MIVPEPTLLEAVTAHYRQRADVMRKDASRARSRGDLRAALKLVDKALLLEKAAAAEWLNPDPPAR